MTNWKDNIHPNFTSELQAEWEKREFDYKTVEELVQIWGKSFDPNDYGFFNFIKSMSNNNQLKESKRDEEKLRLDYQKYLEEEVEKLQIKLKDLEVKLTEWGESWEEVRKEYLEVEKKLRQIHFNKLKKDIENKINKKQQYILELLLETQEEVAKDNKNSYAQRMLEKHKKQLEGKIDPQELEELCKAQLEVIDIDKIQLSPSDIVKKMPQLNKNYLFLVEQHESNKKSLFSLITFKSRKDDRKVINYDLEKAKEEKICNTILQKQVSNSSNSDSRHNEKYVYKKSSIRTWNNSAGLEMGTNISVKAGIPTLAEGKVVLSPKVSYSHQWGGSENEEFTIESSSEFNVPANSICKINVNIEKLKITVPFSYIEHGVINDNGVYESIEKCDIKVDLTETKIEIPPKQ
jgi:hypothetical protein